VDSINGSRVARVATGYRLARRTGLV